MKKILILLISFVFLSSCSSYSYVPKGAEDSVKLAIISDPHYIDPALVGEFFYEEQELSDGKLSIYIDELMDTFVWQMEKEKPDLVIVTGDLTYNGAKASHESFAKKLEKLKAEQIQSLVIPGNHDLLNVHSTDYSKEVLYNSPFIDVETYEEIYANFGYNDCISRDENSLSYLYKASESLWLLMLDSNTYEKNSNFAPSSEGYIKDETMEWIKASLAEKPTDVEVLAFMHHPVLDHAGAQSYIVKNPKKVLSFFEEQGIKLSFSGHVHVQNYKQQENHTNVSVSSLAVYDHQYTIVEYIPNETINISTHNLDVEQYAKEHRLNDDFLLNFNETSYEYFKKYSTTRLVGAYDGDDISQELSNRLFELKGIANTYQFKGEGYLFREILESDPYYDEISNYRKSHASSLFSMLRFNEVDATYLEIDLK